MTSIIKVDQIQTAAGGVPTAADLGLNVSGTVLQIVSVSFNTSSHNTTNSTSYVPTPITASITPKSASSKILVSANFGMIYAPANDAVMLAIHRGTTYLASNSYNNYTRATGTSSSLYASSTVEWTDTPATTNPTTYTVYCRSNGGTIYAPHGGSQNTIKLIEIAG